MRRGDVVIVQLDPAQTAEAAKRRPCVIVSNDGANIRAQQLGRGVVTIVPITSNVDFVAERFEVGVTDADEFTSMGLSMPSKVQAGQVRTVSVARIDMTVGTCSVAVLRAIDNALRFHLSL